MDVKRFSRDRRTSVDYESYTGQTNTSMPSVDDKQRRHSSTVYSDYYSNTFKVPLKYSLELRVQVSVNNYAINDRCQPRKTSRIFGRKLFDNYPLNL